MDAPLESLVGAPLESLLEAPLESLLDVLLDQVSILGAQEVHFLRSI